MAAELTLDTLLEQAVGPKNAKTLAEVFGFGNVEDLLRHYPRRYSHRGDLTVLAGLEPGEHVTVVAQVRSFRSIRNKAKGTRQVAEVGDGTGTLTLVWFNQPWRKNELVPGRRGLFAGQIGVFNQQRQLAHPEYQLFDEADSIDAQRFAEEITPIYPASAKVSSWSLAKLISSVLVRTDLDVDPIPQAVREQHGLIGLAQALKAIHEPKSDEEIEQARKRLKWDEAFALQVVLAQQRAREDALPAQPRHERTDGLLAEFDRRLPFALTAGQREVCNTIAADLAAGHPMHRLLQGEVGSGKTVVALRAMLTVVDSGGQAALLAPTEVLATQHYRAITGLLGELAERGKLGAHDEGTGVTLLTGSLSTAARRQALLDITSGQAGIVVGTHALLEDRVDFFDLGLVVIDEQHRFGVEQRATLVSKAGSDRRPHVLVMTATPIPRTVAMTAFGALDISTLAELPGGRSPISTFVVPAQEKPGHLLRAWARVVEEVGKGHQCYVVVPRIASTKDEVAAANGHRPAIALEDLVPLLESGPLAGLRIGSLHGGMSGADKDDAMRRFALGPSSKDGIDVLVSTTVIEVGVDVPNATMMVVMDADRFGMSQLHQIRGRVGRGQAPGLCLLVTDAEPGSKARERLDAIAATTDGFRIAELDLEQRHEGDILGREQSGARRALRFVEVFRDEELLTQARVEAEHVVSLDPELTKHPGLARAVHALIAAEQQEFVVKS